MNSLMVDFTYRMDRLQNLMVQQLLTTNQNIKFAAVVAIQLILTMIKAAGRKTHLAGYFFTNYHKQIESLYLFPNEDVFIFYYLLLCKEYQLHFLPFLRDSNQEFGLRFFPLHHLFLGMRNL